MNGVKYLSLFSGIGGFEIGIQNAYRSANRGSQSNQASNRNEPETSQDVRAKNRRTGSSTPDSTDQRPLCIGYSEIDKYAIKVYERQFNGHTNYGDITTINPTDLPDFDLVVGGFPCQSFSIAGKRRGFEDTRGTLFFDIARILSVKRPRHLVLENVKGLLSHDSGKTFQTILGVLTDLGYRVEWQVLNSKNFGVPQNRERIYIIGHLRGECSGQVLPISGANEEDTRIVGQDVAYAIDANYAKGTNTLAKSRRSIVQLNQPKHSNDRVYSDKGISPTINTAQGGNRQPFIAAQRGRGNPTVQQLEPQVEDKTNTLTGVAKDNLVVDLPKIRRLTPLECERLQGFPDQWTAGESDSQRYKMCGNAVTTNVVEAVMSALLTEGCI